MTKKSLMNEIEKLSLAEQLKLAAEIVERVSESADETPLTPAQLAELKRRIAYYEKHPDELIPLEDVEAELDARIKSR